MSNVTSKAATVTRILLGLVFFVFGLNGFFHFLPMPPLEGKAGDFMGALAASGFMFPLIKGTEVIAGAALLSNRFVPLALTIVAPVIVNIAAFHFVLAPTNLGIVFFLLGAELFLAWTYRRSFAPLLTATTTTVTEKAPSQTLVAAKV